MPCLWEVKKTRGCCRGSRPEQQQATTEDLLKRILDVLTGIKLSGDIMKNGIPEVNLSLW